MRARTGKIARLPVAVREELNHRLENGALGRELVPWLNELPEVKQILAERFAGRPILEEKRLPMASRRISGLAAGTRTPQTPARTD